MQALIVALFCVGVWVVAQMVAFAACLWLVNVKGWRKWGLPFQTFGANPLFICLLSILWIKTAMRLVQFSWPDGGIVSGYDWVFNTWFSPWACPYNGSLAFALAHVLIFGMVAMGMWKRGWYMPLVDGHFYSPMIFTSTRLRRLPSNSP